MFYVFLNIRRRSTSCRAGGVRSRTYFIGLRISSRGDNGSARPPVGYAFMPAVGPSVHAGCQRVHAGYQRVHAGVHAFMQYVNVFMQAARPPGVVQYALY